MRLSSNTIKPVPALCAVVLGFLAGGVCAAIRADFHAEQNYNYERRGYAVFLEEVVRPRLVQTTHEPQFVFIGLPGPEVKELRRPAICTHVPGVKRGGVIIGSECVIPQ